MRADHGLGRARVVIGGHALNVNEIRARETLACPSSNARETLAFSAKQRFCGGFEIVQGVCQARFTVEATSN